jgi:hypothetical protein
MGVLEARCDARSSARAHTVSVERCIQCALSELLLTFALTAKQNMTIRKGMVLDPFDAAAAAREKFLDGFLSRACIDLGRHDALPGWSSGYTALASAGCEDR